MKEFRFVCWFANPSPRSEFRVPLPALPLDARDGQEEVREQLGERPVVHQVVLCVAATPYSPRACGLLPSEFCLRWCARLHVCCRDGVPFCHFIRHLCPFPLRARSIGHFAAPIWDRAARQLRSVQPVDPGSVAALLLRKSMAAGTQLGLPTLVGAGRVLLLAGAVGLSPL